MSEENENIIELTDDEGNTVEFEHLLTFEYGENFYCALLPVEPLPDMEDGEVLIMRVEEQDDGDLILPVETEEELEGAWNVFLEEYYGDDECGCEDCECDEEECGCGCCGHDHKHEE